MERQWQEKKHCRRSLSEGRYCCEPQLMGVGSAWLTTQAFFLALGTRGAMHVLHCQAPFTVAQAPGTVVAQLSMGHVLEGVCVSSRAEGRARRYSSQRKAATGCNT